MYRQKQRYHRTPKTLDGINSARSKQVISRWWNKCYTDKVIFNKLSCQDLKHNVHYKGPLPWPDKVAFRSLYEEFVLYTGYEITPNAFCAFLYPIAGLQSGSETSKEHVTIQGKKLWKTSRTLLSLPR